MRKTLLVLTLIAASFAGGAAVNGPGLTWLRDAVGLTPARLLGSPEPPADADDDAGEAENDPAPPPTPRPRAGNRITKPSTVVAKPKEPTSEPAVRPAPAAASTPSESEVAAPSLAGSQPPALEPPSTQPTAVNSAASPRDPDLTRSAIAAPSDPTTAPPPIASALPPTTPPPTNWASLMDRLKAQGVTRYWVEGEPGGPARFRCSVPIPGHSSVAQQFEARGDDAYLAAQATLRRIIAWRVTENP